MSRRFERAVLTCGAIAAGLLMPAGALATFPGSNGQIAFVNLTGAPGSSQDIFAFGPRGQDRIQLTNTPRG